jgi:hypothetical protein
MTIILQKLASWAQQLQSLQQSRELLYTGHEQQSCCKIWHLEPSHSNLCEDHMDYYMLVMDDNHVGKIGILDPAAPIFAEIT